MTTRPPEEVAREFLLSRPVGIITEPYGKSAQGFAFMAAHAVPAEVEALTSLLRTARAEAIEEAQAAYHTEYRHHLPMERCQNDGCKRIRALKGKP